MADAVAEAPARHSRFWLYTPFVLLALVALAWSVAWWVIRDQVTAGLDSWLAAEQRAGRRWTCPDRTVGGYPFRIQVTCPSLTLRRGEAAASFGRVQSFSQVYQPRHVIVQIGGPLKLSDGPFTVQGTWQLLEASVRGSSQGLQRLSLVSEGPNVQVTGTGTADMALSAQRLEAHARPNPSGRQEHAYDVAASVAQAKLPPLDALLGGAEPTNIQLDATATQAEGFTGRPLVDELERWRTANGRLKVLQLQVVKGPRRLQAAGELRLDEAHRPAGELAVSAAGLEALIGNLTGNRLGGNLLGALLGQGARPSGAPSNGSNLAALPPFRLDNGRVAIGPFVVPNVQLPALY